MEEFLNLKQILTECCLLDYLRFGCRFFPMHCKTFTVRDLPRFMDGWDCCQISQIRFNQLFSDLLKIKTQSTFAIQPFQQAWQSPLYKTNSLSPPASHNNAQLYPIFLYFSISAPDTNYSAFMQLIYWKAINDDSKSLKIVTQSKKFFIFLILISSILAIVRWGFLNLSTLCS